MPAGFGLGGPLCLMRMFNVQLSFRRETVLLLERHYFQLQMRLVSIGVWSGDCAIAQHSKPPLDSHAMPRSSS